MRRVRQAPRTVHLRGARAVGGQLERRQRPAQARGEVIEGRARLGAVGARALPRGVVAVLQLGLGSRERAPGARGGVVLAELVAQDAHRGRVAGDVVHRQEQHVLLVGEPPQRGAQRRPLGQVERAAELGARELQRARVAARGRQRRQVLGDERELDLRERVLHGPLVHLREARAQGSRGAPRARPARAPSAAASSGPTRCAASGTW
jgi:hypothetical protein